MPDKKELSTTDISAKQVMFSTVKEKGVMIGIIISFISAPLLSWWFLIVGIALSLYLLWHGFNEWKEKNDFIDARFSEFVKELWYDQPLADFIPDISIAQKELNSKAEENPEKRQYKIDRLKELISQRENLFLKGFAPYSEVINFERSYHPRVEEFLAKYFDDSYVERFQQNPKNALEEILNELLDS